MFEKGRKKGSVKFSVAPAGSAAKVELAGDFNGWQPQAMRKGKDGRFACTIDLAGGSYEYKFLVDGNWIVDPENNAWALNPFGSVNSVAMVS
jgi:1,4-alpha-glucan branching enzyme